MQTRSTLADRWNRLWGYDLFISYSQRDSLPYARQLEQALRKRKFQSFRDEHQLHASDHLPTTLEVALRKSRVLLLVLSPQALASKWVRQELTTYLALPPPRQVLPVYFGSRLPEELPPPFDVLHDYLGIPEEPQRWSLGPSDKVLDDIERRFRAVRQRTLRRMGLGTLTLGLLAAAWAGKSRLELARAETRQRAWLARAESLRHGRYNDLAELALARAVAEGAPWSDSLRSRYQEARQGRLLLPVASWNVGASERLIHWTAWKGESVAVLRDHDTGQLWLHHRGSRTQLGPPCETSPKVASSPPLLAWTCGQELRRVRLDVPEDVRHLSLGLEPEELRLFPQQLRLLERTDKEVRVRALEPLTLSSSLTTPLGPAEDFPLVHLCPTPDPLAYGVSREDRGFRLLRWPEAPGSAPTSESFLPPDDLHSPFRSSLDSAFSAPRCDRFLFHSFRWALPGQPGTSGWFQYTPGDLRAPLPLESGLHTPHLVDARTGAELLYLTDTKDLRLLSVTSPVVLQPEVATLASRVHTFTPWPDSQPHPLRLLTVQGRELLILQGSEVVARHSTGSEVVLGVWASEDGAFVAIEGKALITVWRRAPDVESDGPPRLEAISRELGVEWAADGAPRYTAFPSVTLEAWREQDP